MSSFKDVCASFSLFMKSLIGQIAKRHEEQYLSMYCEICADATSGTPEEHRVGAHEARFVLIAGSCELRICSHHHPNPKIGKLSHQLHAYLEKNDLIWTDLYVVDHDARKFI